MMMGGDVAFGCLEGEQLLLTFESQTRMLRDVDPQKLEAVAKKVDGRNSFGTQYNEQTA